MINLDLGYVHRPEDFHFQDGIFELCTAAQARGYLLIVVTNQAGIARGYYTETAFAELTTWMEREFEARNIRLARVYYCPYHPTEGIGTYRQDSADRKPQPGMLYRAREDLDIDLTSSILIGDKSSDIEAAAAAGIGTRILLLSSDIDFEPKIREPEFHTARSLREIRSRFFSGPT